MYPTEMTDPIRDEVHQIGLTELKTPADVDTALTKPGTALVFVNSICGCAAGGARPGLFLALKDAAKKPDQVTTVFAGVDQEAVAKMREMTAPYPPSSPSIALFKDGELVHFVERHHIEGRNAEMIGNHLIQVFEEYC